MTEVSGVGSSTETDGKAQSVADEFQQSVAEAGAVGGAPTPEQAGGGEGGETTSPPGQNLLGTGADPTDATEDAARTALRDEVAEALATGDPLAVQRLASREGRDPFAVADALDEAVERLWDEALASSEGLARAENAQAARDGVVMGRGPVTFAIALEYTLRDVGAIGPEEELTSLDQVRGIVGATPDAIAFDVRDAVDRAQAASGLVAEDDFGIFQNPLPPPTDRGLFGDLVDFVSDEIVAPIEDLLALSNPSAATVGWLFPRAAPIEGIAIVSMPWGPDGPNEIWDFTRTDGDPGNVILFNIKIEGFQPREGAPPSALPRDMLKRTLAIGLEPELANLGAFLDGEAPLFGEDGLIRRFDVGGGYTQVGVVPDMPIGRERFPSQTFIGNIRGGPVFEDDQRVYSINLGVNFGVDSLATLGALGVGGAAMAVPGGQKIGAGALVGAGRIDRAGLAARQTVGMATLGLAWRVEARFDTADHPNGPGFDGIYFNGDRLDTWSDGVANALAQEAAARGLTIPELVESGGAPDAVMAGLGLAP